MTRVWMSGRKDERLFLCPWTPPSSFCSAARVFCTLKHTVTSTTAQSFFSQLHGEKKGLLDKSHFSKWRGHANAEVITLGEWKQRKQIAKTETNIGNVWLHSKLRPISRPSSCMWSLYFLCLSLCGLSPPHPSQSSFQNSKAYSIFSISAYHLFTLLWNLPFFPLKLPGVLKDFLQSVANRRRGNPASHHKQ